MTQAYAIEAELELRRRTRTGAHLEAPADWEQWCKTLFPNAFNKPFAQRHVEMWEWISALQRDVKPKAFIGLWGRGGAKSTNAETGAIYIGAKEKRKFGLYVSSTQLKADAHVASISSKLEDKNFGQYYRKMSQRAINQYGSSKGWRRDILRCKNGFTLQSFGLDTGMRGIKVDDYRPDFIIVDDVDEAFESLTVTLKKEQIITDSILPSGSSDCAVLFVQNLIHSDSIASRLNDGRADFLRNRIKSGPFPAINNLTYEEYKDEIGDIHYRITGGEPTWQGQNIAICQEQMNDWGLSSFLRESQHDVDRTGGIWDHITFMHKEWTPELERQFINVVVWVDPAVTSTDNSDCQGISAGASLPDGKMIFLYWWEGIDTPHKALKRAIYLGYEYGASHVGVETDNGGDTWKSAYQLAVLEIKQELADKWKAENIDKHIDEMPEIILPKFAADKAGHGHGGKIERNQRMLTDYERGLVYHLTGTHTAGEKALRRFPNTPLDLADSMYWTWFDLIGKKKARLRSTTA